MCVVYRDHPILFLCLCVLIVSRNYADSVSVFLCVLYWDHAILPVYVQIVCRNLCETQEASRLLCRRYADHCRRHIVEIMLTTTTKPTSCTKFRFDSIFFLLVFLVVVVFLHDCISCPGTNRIEETVISRLHIGHSFFVFVLKGEEPPVCIPCNHWTYSAYLVWFHRNKQRNDIFLLDLWGFYLITFLWIIIRNRAKFFEDYKFLITF